MRLHPIALVLVALAVTSCGDGAGQGGRPDATDADGDRPSDAAAGAPDAPSESDVPAAADALSAADADGAGSGETSCSEQTGPCGPCGLPGPGGCAPIGVAACPEGFVRDGCGCAPVLDEDCGAGAIPRLGGGCVPVGPAECAAGYELTPGDGCRARVDTCGPDELPLLGGGCVAVGDIQGCGEGTFGDIPDEPGTVYVDPDAAGEAPAGTRADPYRDLATALAAAPDGGTIALAAGRYTSYPAVDRPLTLRGRCAARVTLAGAVPFTIPDVLEGESARLFVTGAAGVTVEGVAVEGGPTFGIVAADAQDVTVRQVRVGAVHNGILAIGVQGVTVEQTRVTGAERAGLQLQDADDVTVRRCLVEETREDDGTFGWGVVIGGGGGTHRAEENVVRDSHGGGIRLSRASGVVRGNLVRGTGPSTGGGAPCGVDVTECASAVVEGNTVEGGSHTGIRVLRADPLEIAASDVLLVGNQVVGIAPLAGSSACAAVVVGLGSGADHLELSRNVVDVPGCYGLMVSGPVPVTIEENTVRAARAAGIIVESVSGDLRGNLVSGVAYSPSINGASAIAVSGGTGGGPPPTLTVSGNEIRDSEWGGLMVGLVAGSVEYNGIHDVGTTEDAAAAAFGLFVTRSAGVTVRGNVVVRTPRAGLYFSRSTGTLEANVVTDVRSSPPRVDADGIAWFMGYGVTISAAPEFLASRNVVRGATLEGISTYSSGGTLAGNTVEDIAPALPLDSGFGIACFATEEDPGHLVVRGNTVVRATGAGILLVRGSGTVDGNAVRDVGPGDVLGLEPGQRQTVSDGVEVFGAAADVRACHVTGAARAGVVATASSGLVEGNFVYGAVFGVDREGAPLVEFGPNACCDVPNVCAAEGQGFVVQSQPTPLPPAPQ